MGLHPCGPWFLPTPEASNECSLIQILLVSTSLAWAPLLHICISWPWTCIFPRFQHIHPWQPQPLGYLFNKWANHWLGCEYPAMSVLFCTHCIQLSSGAAFLSIVSVFSVLIWNGISLTSSSLHMPVQFDENLHHCMQIRLFTWKIVVENSE